MSTKSRAKALRRDHVRAEHLAAVKTQQARASRRGRLITLAAWTIAVALVAGVVAAMMLDSRPASTTATRQAPGFSLPTTAGDTVNLADYRGRNVVLYFSEGAGCQSCILQMGEIEKQKAAFDAAGVTVLPIVMNTKEQITADLERYAVTTPFLLDDGTVSKAYGTLGKGMHEGLPGHSFVLVDTRGTQRWYGEYPSMWLAPTELLQQVEKHLEA